MGPVRALNINGGYFVLVAVTLLIVGIAALWDIKTKRIPNKLLIPVILLGIIINTIFTGYMGLMNAFIGIFVGIMLLLVPFALGGMGAGDVKLLAAVGALNGSLFVFHTFLFSAIAGGVIAVIILLIKKQLFPVLFNLLSILRNLPVYIFQKGQRKEIVPLISDISFPFGTAIFLGTVAATWVR